MIVDLHYKIEGSGPRLCLLHPVGLDLSFFDALATELTKHFQLLRVDLRGHGASAPIALDDHPTLADFASDVHALLEKLHFLPTAIAGFSFGGMVAQELIPGFSADINALVVSACACTFTDEVRAALRARGLAAERDGMISVLDTTMERWFTPSFRAHGLDMPARERLLSNDVQNWKRTWDAISGLDTEGRLSGIRVPTLCLAAGKDISTPPAVVKRIADAVPDASYLVMENLPHMLFIEAPKEVADIIGNFLREALL